MSRANNLQGARQLGVRTEAIRIVAFSLNGCMAALAGIVFASQIGFIPNQTGTGLEMKAIAACVLGGISLLGGSGADHRCGTRRMVPDADR